MNYAIHGNLGAGTGRASDQGGPRQRPSNWYLMGESRGALKHPARCLKMGTNKVGKGKEMDVRLPSRKTSTFHCILNVTANEVILRDRVSDMSPLLNRRSHHRNAIDLFVNFRAEMEHT